MVLSRPALKYIFMANIVLMAVLLGTSLYASNGPVGIPVSHSDIFNQQQNTARTDSGWLHLAVADTGGTVDTSDCRSRGLPEGCPPLKDLVIINLNKLQFGKVVAGGGDQGAVTINPENGNKTVTGVFDGGGRHGPAEYLIEGEPGHKIRVNFPADILLAGSGGQASTVSRFTGYFANGWTLKSETWVVGKLGLDGKAVIQVGGTVSIPPNHAPGELAAQTDIFVDYLF
jgi:Domain of unknown function (DUF4402)